MVEATNTNRSCQETWSSTSKDEGSVSENVGMGHTHTHVCKAFETFLLRNLQ